MNISAPDESAFAEAAPPAAPRSRYLTAITLLLRYLAACVSATIISFLLLYFLTSLSGDLISAVPKYESTLGSLLPALTFGIIGFSGTWIGSLFLPRSGRAAGAVILTVLGLLAGATLWLIDISMVGLGPDSFTSLAFMELSLCAGATLNALLQKIRSTARRGATSP
jgi:hypothetical protein